MLWIIYSFFMLHVLDFSSFHVFNVVYMILVAKTTCLAKLSKSKVPIPSTPLPFQIKQYDFATILTPSTWFYFLIEENDFINNFDTFYLVLYPLTIFFEIRHKRISGFTHLKYTLYSWKWFSIFLLKDKSRNFDYFSFLSPILWFSL